MKVAILMLLLSLWPFQGIEATPFVHSTIVDSKDVKRSKLGLSNHRIIDFKTVYSSSIPSIHRCVWPDFCLKHLQEDPESCSEWDLDKTGALQLRFLKAGHSEAQIDRELINELGNLIELIPQRVRGAKFCDYAWCPTCSQVVIRGMCSIEEEDDEDDALPSYQMVYKCGCTGKCWLDIDDLCDEDSKIYEGWKFCRAPPIFHGYLEWHHQTYFKHLKSYFTYQQENPKCYCYWPEIHPDAKEISNLLYTKLSILFSATKFDSICQTFSPYLKNRSAHGFKSGFLTNSFFYSQYRNIILDLDQHALRELPFKDYSDFHNILIDIEESMNWPFLKLYNRCLQIHPHPKIYYERGMVLFHRGNNLDALDDINKFIDYAEKKRHNEILTSDLYLKEGRLLSESLSYDDAIIALTKAIEKDYSNQEAYLERALAYFENGDFSQALSDYLAAGIRPKKIDLKRVGKFSSIAFGQGMTIGIFKGGQDSVVEFVPSLLSCLRGVSIGVWAFVSSPIEVSQDMVDCANACLEFIKKKTSKEMLCKLVPELKECVQQWDRLDEFTKGRYIGYVIGKYGVDIFMTTGSVKTVQLYRNLRRANAIMTLETAATSPKLAKEVLEQAVRQEKIREAILKSSNLKIQWDKQGKHIKGHKNYLSEKRKSIFTHENPQALVDKYAGTGMKYGNKRPGNPGYKEDIDFEELIGYAVDSITGNQIQTTCGRIHYAKDGVHIVPIMPRGYL